MGAPSCYPMLKRIRGSIVCYCWKLDQIETGKSPIRVRAQEGDLESKTISSTWNWINPMEIKVQQLIMIIQVGFEKLDTHLWWLEHNWSYRTRIQLILVPLGRQFKILQLFSWELCLIRKGVGWAAVQTATQPSKGKIVKTAKEQFAS